MINKENQNLKRRDRDQNLLIQVLPQVHPQDLDQEKRRRKILIQNHGIVIEINREIERILRSIKNIIRKKKTENKRKKRKKESIECSQ